jgi:neutral ceramidase
MKRFGIISGIFLGIIFLIFIFNTSPVKRTSFFEEDYYKQTTTRMDSIKSVFVCENDSIKSGFAKVSITPSLHNSKDDFSAGKFKQVPLAGYGARKGMAATGIHDSIFIKAVSLKVNHKLIVLVSADLLIMPPNIIDSVTFLLSKSGIQREQLFFSATHTHSSLGGWGSGFVGEQFAGKENKNLEKWLSFQIAKSVTQAISDLKPARIGSGSFNAGIYTRNRLIGESGTKNDDFCFICIEQQGKRKAIIGSFSAHSTTLGDENMEISADYPGYWERETEEKAADLALFFAGSVGSQSPVGEGEGFEKSKYIGESLADSLIGHLPEVILKDKIIFSSVSLKVQLPEYHARLTTKINLSSYLSKKLMVQPENVYLQAFGIDNMVWITTPGDFSGEYALEIKNALFAKGFNSNVASFNGSYVGYIVPGRYFYLNEYESKLMGWFGPYMGDYMMHLIRQISGIMTDTNKKINI